MQSEHAAQKALTEPLFVIVDSILICWSATEIPFSRAFRRQVF